MCHLSHAYGDGACLYLTIAGQSEGWYVPAWDAAAAAVLAAGGVLSHHHGRLNTAGVRPTEPAAVVRSSASSDVATVLVTPRTETRACRGWEWERGPRQEDLGDDREGPPRSSTDSGRSCLDGFACRSARGPSA